MGGFTSFAISFSVISIVTGISQLYGYGLQHGGPLQMSVGWWFVSLFTLTVAMAMAELASAYPTAGALYHWSSFLGGRRLGWFTACFNTIGQFAILAGIDYGLALYLVSLFGWAAGMAVPAYAVLLLSHALFNHFGVRVVSALNNFSAWYHMAVVAIFLAALATKGFAQPARFLFTFHQADSYSPPYSFLIGILIAQWTLTGYDASAHVSEEIVDPRKNAPWGIVIAVAMSIVFGSLVLIAVTLSIPDIGRAAAFGDTAFVEILKARLGTGLGGALAVTIAGAMWLCGLAALTSSSRMVYAFARDGGLPFSKFWAKINRAHKTPSNAIWGLAALAMCLAVSVDAYSAVVSIATISLYVSYGLPILARFRARRKGHDRVKGPWHLGVLSFPISVIAVLWIAFICVLFVLPPNTQAGKMLLGSLTVLVLIWIFVADRRFPGPKVKF
ncbi:MAG: amino acid permease [Deltaproteobacteria bacterium]|nr:amino acid permease [Deltaproteobacteria bacterium]